MFPAASSRSAEILATIRRVVLRNFYRPLYRDSNGDMARSILVAGTGRSGTTWLGELLAAQLGCRMMFEPFHCRKVPQYREFNYFQYLRPEQDCEPMSAFCEAVFSGRIRGPWIDRQARRLRPTWRLIKEVRANLLLGWIARRFPEVRSLFIIRHPCAVVHSRLRLNWDTDGDLQPMLSQPELVADHLAEHLALIESTRSDAGKHALVWCISNLVPLRQLAGAGLNVVYYERLRDEPRVEVPRIFAALGQPFDESIFDSLPKPSATTHATPMPGHAASGRAAAWQSEMTAAQIEEVLAIVEAFGLGHHYGDAVYPLGAGPQASIEPA